MLVFYWIAAIILWSAEAKVAPATTQPPFQCGQNEVYTGDQNCLTACPPTCGDEMAGACISVCAQRDCSCKNFYVIDPRNFGKCVLRKDCTPPCGPNQVDTSGNSCQSACPPSCKIPIPDVCTDNCVWRACSCAPGYYINDAGKCVPWKECPPIPDPCKSKVCPPDQDCVSQESNCGKPPCPKKAICVPRSTPAPTPAPTPVPAPSDCSNYPCRQCNYHCEMVQDDPNCQHYKCNQHPECLPKKTTCDNFPCNDPYVCRLVPVVCITCPCWPQPQCLPPPCPPNSSFRLSCKACEKTCPPSSVPDPCNLPCAPSEECYCDPPYLRDPNGNCVNIKDCPGCRSG